MRLKLIMLLVTALN